MVNRLNGFRSGLVGFIDWLDGARCIQSKRRKKNENDANPRANSDVAMMLAGCDESAGNTHS